MTKTNTQERIEGAINYQEYECLDASERIADNLKDINALYHEMRNLIDNKDFSTVQMQHNISMMKKVLDSMDFNCNSLYNHRHTISVMTGISRWMSEDQDAE